MTGTRSLAQAASFGVNNKTKQHVLRLARKHGDAVLKPFTMPQRND